MTLDRRTFLSVAAAGGAAWAVLDAEAVREALAHAAAARSQQPPPRFTVLSAADAADLEAMASRIMPTTETPGAREAGVVHFMDRALATFEKGSLPAVRRGLGDLRARVARRKSGARTFAELDASAQDALLEDIAETPFFEIVRVGTMVGMFADPSYGGNRDRVGWKLLGFEPRSAHAPPFGHYDAEVHRGGTR